MYILIDLLLCRLYLKMLVSHTVGLIVFKDIKFRDSKNLALNKNFRGKIFDVIDNP